MKRELKNFLIVCCCLSFVPDSFSQVKSMIVLSSVTYNSGAGVNDGAMAITVDAGENIYVAGYKGDDILAIKYSPTLGEGDSQIYSNGRSGNKANGIAIDSMGKIIVTGVMTNVSMGQDYYTIKYSPDFASQISSVAYDSTNIDEATAVKVDSKDNIFVTGYVYNATTNNNFYTIKYDSNLYELKNATYPGGGDDKSMAMAIDADDNVIVGGYTTIGGTKDFFIRKYDNNLGNPKSDAPVGAGDDRITGIAVDNSGNIIAVGQQQDVTTSSMNICIVKYDDSLTMISSTVFASGELSNIPGGVAVDSMDNIIVAGYFGVGGILDYLVLKYDKNLTLISSAVYNGGGTDKAMAVTVDASDNVIITGAVNNGTDNDWFTIKYNASPKITEVTPLYIGETANITIKGRGFFSDTDISFLDAGISTGSKSYIPPGQINLSVTLSPSVMLGLTTITVTNSNGEYFTSGTLAETRLRTTIPAGNAKLITAQNSIGEVSVSVPAGSFSEQKTVTIYSFQPLAGDIRQVGEGIYLAVSPAATPSQNISIKIPYRDSDLGGYPEYGLNVGYYDTTAGWLETTSSVNSSENTVTGSTTTVNGKFAVVKAGGTVTIPPPGGLGGATVYPNPYRPGSGGYFDKPDMGEGIVFSDFSPRQTFELTIVDVAGRLVFSESCVADNSGKYLWNTKTASGGKAATGVYLYRIEGGGKERKGKISIIR